MADVSPPHERIGPQASLRWRLPLLISLLVVAALIVVVVAAHRMMVATLERGAGERASRAAHQVTAVVGPLTTQVTAVLQAAAAPVSRLLAEPTAAHRDAASQALTPLATRGRRVTVWDASGGIVLELPARGTPADIAVPPPPAPPSLGTGDIHAGAYGAFADTAVAVTAEEGRRLGTLSLRSLLVLAPPDLLTRLIGGDARIVFGNRSGGGWTDLAGAVDLPAVDPRSEAVQRYRHADGDDRLGALASFGSFAPWVVWVEFPRAPVVAEAGQFLLGTSALAALVAVAAVLAVRRLVTGVTAPLAAMTTAAESMAAGRYDMRVATPRGDEIGRLGRAFDRMADDVAQQLMARRQALQVAANTEGRYRTLFDHAPDGLLIADPQGRYVDANPGICRLLGRTRDELIGRQAADIAVEEEQPHIAPALSTLAAGGAYQRAWRFRRTDGTAVETDVIATTMPDGHILAMVRDMTERNRAAEAVRAAEERMRFALESADVGVWDMDVPSGVVRWSEVLEAQHGLAPGTFGGTVEAVFALIHADDRPRIQEAVAEAFRRGGDFSMQYRIGRPDGALRWIIGTGRVLQAEDGTPVRALGITLDVTEKRVLEAQFQQAQKMEAIGRLAGGVAHDFNNLLTAILGYCELVLDDLRPEDPLRFEVSEIEKAGRHAAALTRQLLAFSRKEIIEPAVIDVNEVVRGVQSLLRRLINEDVEIVFALGGEPLLVNADRGQIEQAVMNLAVNARDAMPAGGRLTIGTAPVELDDTYAETHLDCAPGPYVALTVTDTGMGMTSEVQAHLFEPFFTTKESGKGTGLGLATVHGVVTRAGGSIGVYSELGHGSTFKVYLPRVSATGAAATPPAEMAAPSQGRGRTVLVVDDAEGLRQLMTRTLTRLGFRVLAAADAAEAVGLFNAHPEIDVLLSDVVMPGASGPDLTLGLRSQRPDLKVLYMSGYTEDTIVQHGVLRPGIAFLHKPFTAHALARKIDEVLGA